MARFSAAVVVGLVSASGIDHNELQSGLVSSLNVDLCLPKNQEAHESALVQSVQALAHGVEVKNLGAVATSLELVLGNVQESIDACDTQLGSQGIIQDFAKYLKDNLLNFDEAIIEEMSEMSKVCSFRAPDGKKCGHLLGQILNHIIFGHGENHLFMQAHSSFMGGMMKGLVGNSANYKACRANMGVIMHEAGQMARHLKTHKFGAMLDDLVNIVGMLLNSFRRRQAQLELSFPHPTLPDALQNHTAAKAAAAATAAAVAAPHYSRWSQNRKCELVEETSGQMQVMVTGCKGTGCNANSNDMDCAWCVYDLDTCIESYGETCHETVAAREAQNAACSEPSDSATTMMPDDETTTRHRSTTSMHKRISSTTRSPNEDEKPKPHPHPSPVPSPSPSPHPHPDVEQGACSAAIGDLKPLLSVLHGARGPKGVLDNLKHNLLEADEEMMVLASEMGRYCTFREANAGKCGYRLGAITRDILVGLEKTVFV